MTDYLREAQGAVEDFHRVCGVGNATTPGLCDTTMRWLLLQEEMSELGAAIHNDDIVEAADALADLAYVLLGTASVWGICLDDVFAEVHRSNMTKRGAPRDKNGKITKGPNYEPPNIRRALGLE